MVAARLSECRFSECKRFIESTPFDIPIHGVERGGIVVTIDRIVMKVDRARYLNWVSSLVYANATKWLNRLKIVIMAPCSIPAKAVKLRAMRLEG
jgi:hypothetical protein